EHELEDHVGLVGDGRPVVRIGLQSHPAEADPVEPPDDAALVGPEGQAVPPEHPLHGDQGQDDEALHDRRERVLLAHHPAIEERQARRRHQQHERRGGQQPRGVARIDLRRRTRRPRRSWWPGRSGGLLAGDSPRERQDRAGQQRQHPCPFHRTLPARTPRPSGRGGAPICRGDCPRVELSTRSASGPGDNQAVGPLRHPSTRRRGWTGRRPRSQAGRRTVTLEPPGQALGLTHGLLSLNAPDFSPGELYRAPSSRSPERIRTAVDTGFTKILPSPTLPVLAAAATISTTFEAIGSGATTSILILGMKSIVYSPPRYSSVCPFWRPKPRTSDTVMPTTPMPVSASFTSSSLNGLMIASIFCI